MKTEAETGVMLPQVMEDLGLPEAGRGWKDLLLESQRERGPANTLILGF